MIDQIEKIIEHEIEKRMKEYWYDFVFGGWGEQDLRGLFNKLKNKLGRKEVYSMIMWLFIEAINRGKISLKIKGIKIKDIQGEGNDADGPWGKELPLSSKGWVKFKVLKKPDTEKSPKDLQRLISRALDSLRKEEAREIKSKK